MKKAIIILSSLLIFITGCNHAPQAPKATEPSKPALKQQPGFTGIYEFQINKTTVADLKKLPYRIHEITYQEGITNAVKNHSVDGVTNWELLCPGVRVFKVDDFTKATLHFTLVNLNFYKDTLVDFSCVTDYEIESILKAKYSNYYLVGGSEPYCGWQNNTISATCNYAKDLGEMFGIRNWVVTDKIMEQKDSAKMEYIKKINASM